MKEEFTRVLKAVNAGDPRAMEQLAALVYTELKELAAAKLAREQPGQTLETTALAHEAWLRLTGDGHTHWENRRHFFGAAAEAMRRILIDRARRKRALCHGGHQQRLDVDEVELTTPSPDEELMAVHEIVDRLAAVAPGKAELVKLRYFIGLTLKEAAEVLGISEATAKRHWQYARAWLYRAWNDDGGASNAHRQAH